MKILHIGIFTDNPFDGDNILSKGFSLSHDVYKFDYRKEAQHSIPSMMDKIVQMDETHRFDFILIGKGEIIDPNIISKLKGIKALWYGDQRATVVPEIAKLAKACDFFFHTTAGRRLEEYKQTIGKTKCSFLMIPCDPDLYPSFDEYKYSILFTGGDYPDLADRVRHETLEYLDRRKDFTCFGRKNIPRVLGKEYSRTIVQSKIAMSVNNYNYFEMYSSERLMNYAAGTFTISYAVPLVEKLFENLVTYKSTADLKYKLNYFLIAEDVREDLRSKLVKEVRDKYNYNRVCQHIIEMATTGKSTIFDWSVL